MIRRAMICAAFLLAVPATAQDQLPAADTAPAEEPQQDPLSPLPDETSDVDDAKMKVIDCEGEKFVFAWGAGARPTKVTLCSNKDATADEVVLMLEEAATKLERAASIAEDRRVMIVKQIRAKIAELKRVAEAAPGRAAVAGAAASPSSPEAIAQQPLVPPQRSSRIAISTPPPPFEPAPVPAQPAIASKPRLSFECYTPGQIGSGGPCTVLGRDTRLTVTAGEALPSGIDLRFRRYGETRAQLALKSMRKGQSVRLMIPREVCSGVVEAESEIEVVRGGRVVDSLGPYLLRC